ncbi:MAG TPA: hypothetical protein V6D11_08710 [Waterburya sp.]
MSRIILILLPTAESASGSGEREGAGIASQERTPLENPEGSADRTLSSHPLNSNHPTVSPLVEASGWMYGSYGEVILVARSSTVAPGSSWSKPRTCEN